MHNNMNGVVIMLNKERYEAPLFDVEEYEPVDILTESEDEGGLENGNTDGNI